MRTTQSSRNPAGRAPSALVLGLGLLLAFGLLLLWSAQRELAPHRALAAGAAPHPGIAASAVEPARPLAEEALSAALRVPLESAEVPPAAPPPEPAILSGRLQIDGFAPYDGRVQLRQADGEWRSAARIDPHGRFYVEGVPAARILLGFEAVSLDERRLVLPNEYALTPTAGELELVDLDWKTRHVNLHVVTDLPFARAEVAIRGPGYDTRVETSDNGKARLSLIGSGAFSFHAVLFSGQSGEVSGEVAVELEEGQDLDTVVIPTGSVR